METKPLYRCGQMELSPEMLEKIAELARLGFTHIEVAEILGKDRKEYVEIYFQLSNVFMRLKSPAYRAYRVGFLKGQQELRQQIFKDAMNGSSDAQILAKEIMDGCSQKNSQR